jgi:hypothetical protein
MTVYLLVVGFSAIPKKNKCWLIVENLLHSLKQAEIVGLLDTGWCLMDFAMRFNQFEFFPKFRLQALWIVADHLESTAARWGV